MRYEEQTYLRESERERETGNFRMGKWQQTIEQVTSQVKLANGDRNWYDWIHTRSRRWRVAVVSITSMWV